MVSSGDLSDINNSARMRAGLAGLRPANVLTIMAIFLGDYFLTCKPFRGGKKGCQRRQTGKERDRQKCFSYNP